MTYHTEGIILRREDRREVDRMYVIYTREQGKLLAVGRGTRKILSKLGAHLEPYSAVDLFLARGRRHETVCGASLRRSPEPLVHDDLRHVSTAFIVESFDQLVKWSVQDEELWSLLDGVLEDIAVCASADIPGRVAGYLWRFMDRLGYGPRLDACMICETGDFSSGARFLPLSGGIICAAGACRRESGGPSEREMIGARPLNTAAIGEVRDLYAEKIIAVRRPENIALAQTFLEAHLDRPLMTRGIFRELTPQVDQSARVS